MNIDPEKVISENHDWPLPLFFFREALGRKAGGNTVSLMTHVPVAVSGW